MAFVATKMPPLAGLRAGKHCSIGVGKMRPAEFQTWAKTSPPYTRGRNPG